MGKYLLIIITSFLISSKSLGEEYFLVKFGKEVRTNKVVESNNKVIIYNDEIYQYFELSNNYDTKSWTLTNFSKKTIINGKKEGNTIKLEKKSENNSNVKEHKIDNNPWYQSWESSLRVLLFSEEKEITFWAINPDNLNISKMKAVRENEETITIGNKNFNAVKIKAYFDGPASIFGNLYYWYNKNNGKILKYKSDFKFLNFEVEKIIN